MREDGEKSRETNDKLSADLKLRHKYSFTHIVLFLNM